LKKFQKNTKNYNGQYMAFPIDVLMDNPFLLGLWFNVQVINIIAQMWHGTQRQPVQSTGIAATGLPMTLPTNYHGRQRRDTVNSPFTPQRLGETARQIAPDEYRPPATHLLTDYDTVSSSLFFYLLMKRSVVCLFFCDTTCQERIK